MVDQESFVVLCNSAMAWAIVFRVIFFLCDDCTGWPVFKGCWVLFYKQRGGFRRACHSGCDDGTINRRKLAYGGLEFGFCYRPDAFRSGRLLKTPV